MPICSVLCFDIALQNISRFKSLLKSKLLICISSKVKKGLLNILKLTKNQQEYKSYYKTYYV